MPELDLSSKGLAELPVDKLKGLTKLDANSNALTKLTKGCFDGSPDLESVEVYANKIKEIEAGVLTPLTKCTTLNAFNNQIKKIPPDLASCVALEELNFAANKMMMLTDAHFAALTALTVLNMQDNNLVRFGSLANCKALEEIRLYGNNLEEIPAIGDGLPALRIIEIHKNRISAIGDDYFAGTPKLQSLNIGKNSLATLPPSLFSKCAELTMVQAEENKIESLPSVDFPAGLQTLFLQDNPWKALPKELAKCSKLKRFNVTNAQSDSATDELIAGLKKIVLSQDGGIFWGKTGEKEMAK